MKFKKSPRKGNILVELEPGNTRLISNLNGPVTGLKKLLVPVDFSECSRHALKYAVAFAKQFDAAITLVAVVPDVHTAFDYGSCEFMEIQEKRRQQYEAELAKLAGQRLGKIPHRLVIRTGRPFEEIIRAAKETGQDLIIISTHGQGGPGNGEFGSTAERVVRYATCPVLVVRPCEHDFVGS